MYNSLVILGIKGFVTKMNGTMSLRLYEQYFGFSKELDIVVYLAL
jgi:hypothetical protein